ncbi:MULTISPECIES: AI-2E family transporter [unclassified Exiguobacterium]|uniref:AI-2E family transporter n=1 Tax=unclassified Exiguobacterium TaxID=2644629 RepID=UPI00103DB463|nr:MULTISPECIES: AI-2E family transporter [unclassified Exiguobacterium]TCI39109.1 AI-2E family transporter [Exiguobacterium sp. SH4S7]TCI48202.1 AI-2E family transporter [Exiguobacterium sp. SH5S32]TCI55089.1 AI-2E family transporter [Exiguobacterium sp. SH1S4]TCI57374.1 AI-2E family transporter [Exiguobacterium sp. SH1S21]TCI63104.1 AI-2E family transporter [Exiguobacterium sp. SH0S2]
MQPFWTTRAFRNGIWVLLILTIIFMAKQVEFLFYPIGIFFATVLTPFLFAGILFYLTVGLVDFLEIKWKRRSLAILSVLLLLLTLVVLFVVTLGPLITRQLLALLDAFPRFAEGSYRQFLLLYGRLEEYAWFRDYAEQNAASIETWIRQLTDALGSLIGTVAGSLGRVLALIVSGLFTLFIALFLYVFMLIDGGKLATAIVRWIPEAYEQNARHILHDMHETIKRYVRAQLIVCTFVGFFATIALWLLDVPFFLPLGLFIFATNIIPYFGPFLGAAPAVLIAFIDEPVKALYVIIAITIVQQLDANVISPLVQGKSLRVHPITITLVLLVAGRLAGIVGMLLAVPFYAVLKVTFLNLQKLYALRKQSKLPIERSD